MKLLRTIFVRSGALSLWVVSSVCFGEEQRVSDLRSVSEVRPGEDAQLRRSRSSTGQFVVYGGDLQDRSQFCVFGEEIYSDLNAFLGFEGVGDDPVVIRIEKSRKTVNKPVRTTIRPYDFGGWLLQIEVFLHENLSRQQIEQEIVRLLLAGRILSHVDQTKFAERKGQVLPDWLHHGILGVLRYRREGRSSETFQAVWNARETMSLDAVLEGVYQAMDTLDRRMFEASATALVYALRRQREGRLSLRQMIEGLGVNDLPPRRSLTQYFPYFDGQSDTLDKFWALEMAALAEGSAFESLGCQRTEALLLRALQIRFPRGKGALEGKDRSQSMVFSSTEDLSLLLRHPKRKEIMSRKAEELMTLNLRAHPLYQPILEEYLDVFLQAARSRRAGRLKKRLGQLEGKRQRAGEILRETELYLDFLEATETLHLSSQFDDYLQIMKALDRPRPPRPDKISRYLDALESEWQ